MKKTKETLIKNCIMAIILVLMTGIFQLVYITRTEAAQMYLSHTSLILTKNSTKKLKIKNLPIANSKITWSTSNKYAVTVSKKGKVKAVNYGVATIKATCCKKVFICQVSVPDSTRTVKLNASSVTMAENTTYQLTATSANPVQYHSGNESIATVNHKGLIKAVNPGIVVITAKTAAGFARCTVTVTSTDQQSISPYWITDKKVTAIRRLTKNNNFVYDDITWAKGKDITFKIANLDESTVKSCVWSISDANIVSKPVVKARSKIQVSAKTLKEGTATITAVVTDYRGDKKTYKSDIYVSSPSINVKNLTLLGPSAGSNRQQFISIAGLSNHSKIQWTNSAYASATLSAYNTKAAVWGVRPGSGTITASVDGKTFKVNYTVMNPVFGAITSVIAKGKKTKINIGGIEGVTPKYSSRNSKIATVDAVGNIKGIKAGVTYVDVTFGNMTFSYRAEVAAKGMKTIINRANYIVNHWKYSQKKRMKSGYYDCSALVWKGYKAYKKYNKKLGGSNWALSAGELFDYLYEKNQIKYFGYTTLDDLQPGDLIFYGDYYSAVKYSTPGRTLDIYHVSMYAGAGKVVEKGGQTINYNNIGHIVGIGRVVN